MKHIISNIDNILEGSGCFRAGTLVLTPKGERSIEKFRKGQKVICFNKLVICLADGTQLKVTANHWLLTPDDEFKEAKDFRVGEHLFTKDYKPVKIDAIIIDRTVDAVYNLKVVPYPTFIVNGIMAHNGGGGKGGASYTATEEPDTLFSIATARVLDLLSEGECAGFVDKYENIVGDDEIGKAIFLNKTPIQSDVKSNYVQRFDRVETNVYHNYFFGNNNQLFLYGDPVRDWKGDNEDPLADPPVGDDVYMYVEDYGSTGLYDWPVDTVNALVTTDKMDDEIFPADFSIRPQSGYTSFQLPVHIAYAAPAYLTKDPSRYQYKFEIISNSTTFYPGSGWTMRVYGNRTTDPILDLPDIIAKEGTGSPLHRRIGVSLLDDPFDKADEYDDRGAIISGLFMAPVTGNITFTLAAKTQARCVIHAYNDPGIGSKLAELETTYHHNWFEWTEKLWFNPVSTSVSMTAGTFYHIRIYYVHRWNDNYVGLKIKYNQGEKTYDHPSIPLPLMSADPEVENSDYLKYIPSDIYAKRGSVRLNTLHENFRGVKLMYQLGTDVTQQQAIIGFAEPSQTVQVGIQVKQKIPWTVNIYDGNAESVDVALRFNGLSKSTAEGDVVKTRVDFKVYKNNVYTESFYVYGKASSAYQVSRTFFPPDNNDGQPWTLTIERTTEDSIKNNSEDEDEAGMNVNDDSFIEFYSVNNTETYNYPNCALIGIETRADQFSSIPTRTYHFKGVKVKLPNGYNPSTRAYPAYWDGTFASNKEWTDNPVWQLYDMSTNKRYGLGAYIEDDMINKWEFYRCSKYCDEMVYTGAIKAVGVYAFENTDNTLFFKTPLTQGIKAGDKIYFEGQSQSTFYLVANANAYKSATSIAITNPEVISSTDGDLMINYKGAEPRFQCSFYYQTFAEAWKAFRDLTTAFRAAVFWMNGGVSLSQDRPITTEHQLFTNSNVKDGLFSYTGGDVNDRYTVCRVQWNDPSQFDEPVVETVENIGGLMRYGQRIKSMTAFGARSRTQAIRLARWYLYTSLYEAEIVSFTAGQEGLYTAPGRVIYIHDKDRDSIVLGGRVKRVENDGSTDTIVVDNYVDFEAGYEYTLVMIIPTDYRTIEEIDDLAEANREAESENIYAPQVVRYRLEEALAGRHEKIPLPTGSTLSLPTGVDGSQLIWAVERSKLSSGPLVAGTLIKYRQYKIADYVSDDDFTNVGALSNATGEYFIATGTIPTTWTNGSTLYEISADAAQWKVITVEDKKDGEVEISAKRYFPQKFEESDRGPFLYSTTSPDPITADPKKPYDFRVTRRKKYDPTATNAYYQLTWGAPVGVGIVGYQLKYETSVNPGNLETISEAYYGTTYDAEMNLDISRFYVRSITIAGKYSDWVTSAIDQEFTAKLSDYAPIIGLELQNRNSNGEYNDKFATLSWRLSNTVAPEMTDDVTADSGSDEAWFKQYRVKLESIDGMFLNEYTTKERRFTYTYDMMVDDFSNAGETLNGDFKCWVAVEDRLGDISRYSMTEVYNASPGNIQNLAVTRDQLGVKIDWDAPAGENDIVKYYIYRTLDTTPPTPGTDDPFAIVAADSYTYKEDIEELGYEPWVQKYYWVAAYDIFDQLGTVSSTGYATVSPLDTLDDFEAVPITPANGGRGFNVTWDVTVPSATVMSAYTGSISNGTATFSSHSFSEGDHVIIIDTAGREWTAKVTEVDGNDVTWAVYYQLL